MLDGSGLLGTLFPHSTTEHAAECAAAAEELLEQVLGGHATTATGALLKTFFAKLVV